MLSEFQLIDRYFKRPLRAGSPVQLGIGVDLLGSLLSLNTRSGNELRYFYGKGCLAISKKTNRIVWVPDSNIRGVEFF